MRLFFWFLFYFFSKKNPKQVVLFSLCAFVLKLQRVSETYKQGCQLIRTLLHMNTRTVQGHIMLNVVVLSSLPFFSFFSPISFLPHFLTFKMRTGCSLQAIVKTFHILPYMVKQQAIRCGLPYTENATPAHSFWKYTIKS